MGKITKEFFTDHEVIFAGYSSADSANSAFCKEIYRTFNRNGIQVFPLNDKENKTFDVKVYKDVKEMPHVPKCAYVLMNKENAEVIIPQLAEGGVKRILFQRKKNITPMLLQKCNALGIEAKVACPMMILGTGMHKFHGILSGVR